jgi:hypothetical protein
MVEAAARRSRLIADARRSEKGRDAEGGGESGEGSTTVLYIVPGARQISALGAPNPVGLAGWGALACIGQLTCTQIARQTHSLCSNPSTVATVI